MTLQKPIVVYSKYCTVCSSVLGYMTPEVYDFLCIDHPIIRRRVMDDTTLAIRHVPAIVFTDRTCLQGTDAVSWISVNVIPMMMGDHDDDAFSSTEVDMRRRDVPPPPRVRFVDETYVSPSSPSPHDDVYEEDEDEEEEEEKGTKKTKKTKKGKGGGADEGHVSPHDAPVVSSMMPTTTPAMIPVVNSSRGDIMGMAQRLQKEREQETPDTVMAMGQSNPVGRRV